MKIRSKKESYTEKHCHCRGATIPAIGNPISAPATCNIHQDLHSAPALATVIAIQHASLYPLHLPHATVHAIQQASLDFYTCLSNCKYHPKLSPAAAAAQQAGTPNCSSSTAHTHAWNCKSNCALHVPALAAAMRVDLPPSCCRSCRPARLSRQTAGAPRHQSGCQAPALQAGG